MAVASLEFYKGHSPLMGAYRIFSLGGGGEDVVRGLTGMGEYFSQVIVVSFC